MDHRESTSEQIMPDIANQGIDRPGLLNWVGMDNIEIPIYFENDNQPTIANVNVYVNLVDTNAKGIHMSRLYLLIDKKLPHSVNPLALKLLLKQLVESHENLSDASKLEISFFFMIRRPSLKSDNSGWRKYPVSIIAQKIKDQFSIELKLDILYSSTCPCSAALARQLIREKFKRDFQNKKLEFNKIENWISNEKEGIIATPHSQRSVAHLKVKFKKEVKSFNIIDLIDCIEKAIGTPVQTAVKREDEQEFAYRNGQNLMFCEDACRKIDRILNEQTQLEDYYIKVKHLESLHPHDAVSSTTKGVPNGYFA